MSSQPRSAIQPWCAPAGVSSFIVTREAQIAAKQTLETLELLTKISFLGTNPKNLAELWLAKHGTTRCLCRRPPDRMYLSSMTFGIRPVCRNAATASATRFLFTVDTGLSKALRTETRTRSIAPWICPSFRARKGVTQEARYARFEESSRA